MGAVNRVSLVAIAVLGSGAVVAAIITLHVRESWWVPAGAFALLLVMAVAVVVDLLTLTEDWAGPPEAIKRIEVPER
ncbi:MAG: hypothetical protein QOJ57_505 [Thermoleophilaceae bacterium]|jgi:hypothetical protein|nr:hypothetical protein [Thermoleophilaceae bacterium]